MGDILETQCILRTPAVWPYITLSREAG